MTELSYHHGFKIQRSMSLCKPRGGEKKKASLYYVIHSTEEYKEQMFNGNRRANIEDKISLLLFTVGTNTPTTTPKTHDNTENIQI